MQRLGAPHLAALYCVLALAFTGFLAIALPPIQGPDEGAHYVRADQISRGELIARRMGAGAAGGVIDRGVMVAVDRFYPVVPDLDARVTRGMYARIGWGEAVPWSFPNTALYPPVFYLPAVAAIVIGKHAGLDVLQTDKLARLFQGAASVAIATAAVALAGSAGPWLFALLLLPSSAALMGSLTQDGPLLACAALAASLLLRLRRPEPRSWRPELVLVCAIIALLGMSRPPYAALALVTLPASGVPLRARLFAFALTLAVTASWWALCAVHILVSVDQSHAANPGAQLHFLITHPGHLPALVQDTLAISFSKDYAGFFITTFAPAGVYHGWAWCDLALAAAVTLLAGSRATLAGAASILAPVGCSILGLFLIQYLTWTPVGAPTVLGVVGRYFLPLAVFMPLATTGRRLLPLAVPAWSMAPVLVFPAVSIALTAQNLILRYYL